MCIGELDCGVVGRVAALLLCFVLPAAAEPPSIVDILSRWDDASPEERRRMSVTLNRLERARRFVDARPVVLAVGKTTYTLAALFQAVLDPALETPLEPQAVTDLGLTDLHRLALKALEELRTAFAAPRPVHAGTVNLMLDYAYRSLTAGTLSLRARVRFFAEAIRNVRALEGRVEPDLRTRWLLHHRLLPTLVGIARRTRRDEGMRDILADAATLLYLPALLDRQAQEMLAPLTRGRESRKLLLRAYRHGALDRLGVAALARGVVARTNDDGAFAAGAAPLILELLCDSRVRPRERRALLDAAIAQLGGLGPFGGTLVDLAAVAYGGPPLPLPRYREERKGERLVVPAESRRVYRFLRVLMIQAPGKPPRVTRVDRIDAPRFRPVRGAADHRGGGGRFVGVLVPAAGGDRGAADFLGPAPQEVVRDHRLLRRRLRLERIAIAEYGSRGEVVELCATLPEDESEPVPERGATLSHVLDLIEARLVRSAEPEERVDLVRLLGRIGTPRANALAARFARKGGAVVALLEIAENGDKGAARSLLRRLGEIDLLQRERAFAAAVNAGLNDSVARFCKAADVGTAALAGDALMAAGDVRGISLLLTHQSRYVRAVGAALALRLTPFAGGFRLQAGEQEMEGIARACGAAFTDQDGGAWMRCGRWLRDSLLHPEKTRMRRLKFAMVRVGKEELTPSRFQRYCVAIFTKDRFTANRPATVAFLLTPYKPGHGIDAEPLAEALDAVESGCLDKTPSGRALRQAYTDALIVLACVQHGIELQPELSKLAHARLSKLAGGKAPPGTRRKPGVFWPIWAASGARG